MDESNSPSREERNWAVILHLSQLSGYLIPLGGYLIPFVIWYLKKDLSSFVDRQGIEAFNFSITMVLFFGVAGILCYVFIGFLILPFLALFALVAPFVAAVKVSQGISYRYPFILRLLS